MSGRSPAYRRFLAELKRRQVFKVAAVYGAVAFAVMQAADFLVPALKLPEAVATTLALVAILGFPIAVVLAWALEVTPEGVRRTASAAGDEIEALATEPRLRRWPSGVLALVGTALLIAGGWWVLARGNAPGEVRPGAEGENLIRSEPERVSDQWPDSRSIAILPFDNISGDQESEVFTLGVHDDIITQLSGINALRVTSRTSVKEYRNTEKAIPQIASELGVASILEGAVRRSGDRVRLNVQLIDARADENIWVDTYDRELSAENIFAIQGEIARSVALALRAELTPEETQRLAEVPTANLEALDAYHQGNALWAVSGADRSVQAIEEYRRAVQLDPNFAAAWAALVKAQAWLVRTGENPDTTPARRSLTRALELAPDAAESRLAAGYYYYYALGDYESALQEFRAAERAAANNPEVLIALSLILRRLGRWEESLGYSETAALLDPRNASTLYNHAYSLQMLRRHAEANRYHERALRVTPEMGESALYHFGGLLWLQGDRMAARAFVTDVESRASADALALWEADLATVRGDYRAAIRALESLDLSMDWEWVDFPGVATDVHTEYAVIKLAKLCHIADDPECTRSYADSAIREATRVLPERIAGDSRDVFGREAVVHAILGQAYALLGDHDRALEESERAVELYSPELDGVDGDSMVRMQIETLILAGEYQRALDRMEYLLDIPAFYTPTVLRLDPIYDPLRDHPHFRRLVEGERAAAAG